jgi:K+/H+ antiporter YhaU regulatory subunit KhtT
MKDVATFFGQSGEIMAMIIEGPGYYRVNYGKTDSPATIASVIFMTEEEATNFAVKYTDTGLRPTFLAE